MADDPPTTPDSNKASPKLRRSLGLPLLILYGLGTVLGAGIYVLIGEVAGRAGEWAPLSFLIASVLSALTAFGFAELGGRFPKSAGEAVYVKEGFGRRDLSLIVGIMVSLSGIVSAAAIAHGFAGYLGEFIEVPNVLAVLTLILVLTALACWGIAESVTAAAILTLVEGGALVFIVAVGAPDAIGGSSEPIVSTHGPVTGFAVLSGAVLAFYAFIGFEDIVNLAEEVRDPQRNIGRAIFWVVIVSTTLYVAVSYIAVRAVNPAELSASEAPMSLLFVKLTGYPTQIMSIVAMLAVVNGALIQIIMSARVLYGLARQGSLPAFFGDVHAATRTPLKGTLVVGGIVLVTALLLPLVTLAEITSTFILVVFTFVNLALIAVKRKSKPPEGVVEVPMIVPVLGALTAGTFAVLALIEVFRG